MKGVKWVVALLLAVMVLAGCSAGSSRNNASINAHIVVEEAYLEPDESLEGYWTLIVVTKNLGPSGVSHVKGILDMLDENGKSIPMGFGPRPPVPATSDDGPSYWMAGQTHTERYFAIKDSKKPHSILVHIWWNNYSGDLGSYRETLVLPYKRQ